MSRLSKKRPNARGYTAIEVLIALTVFAIGASGVIAMERAAVQGNVDARRLDTANSIARAWIERLRRDAMHWNSASATGLNDTVLIKGNYGTGSAGTWILPQASCPTTNSAATPADGNCGAFDAFGQDLDTSHYGNAVFCANYRLDLVGNDLNGNPAVVRAVVRVYWPRGLGQAAYANGTSGFCSAAGLADATQGPDAPNALQMYHFVQATTLLTNSVVPQ